MNRWSIFLAIIVACVAMPAVFVGCKSPAPENAKGQPPADATKDAQKSSKADQKAKGAEETAAGPEAVSKAKDALTKGNAHVGAEAIRKLADIASGPAGETRDAALQLLREQALTGASAETRAAAVSALGADPGKSWDILIKATKDPEPGVRSAAARIISLTPTPQAEQALAKIVKEDQDPAVKQAATLGLTNMYAARTGGEYGPLLAQLGQDEGDAPALAAIALTLKGDPALDALIACLRTSPSGRQRHGAAICIAMICAGTNPTQMNFARLAKATSREEQHLRPSNLKGLEPLIAALKDPEPMVREIAAQGLGYLGDERATAPLAAALSDPDDMVRRRAASALITIPAVSALPQLSHTATSDSSPAVRRFAAEALGWINDPRVVEPLIKAAADTSPEVRRYAATELGRRGEKSAVTALTNLFNDPDDDVRWAAVLAVGNLRDRQAEDALVKALNDPAPQVANAAERALQRLGIAKRKLEPGERAYPERG